MKHLGLLLHFKFLYVQAEPLFRRALVINEAILGPDHPKVAMCLNNLGQLLLRTNRPAVAEQLMRRALAIDEKASDRTIPVSRLASTTSLGCCETPTGCPRRNR
jgi:Tfp pilus assembly protein PilF